jgi:dTDP-4-dehydrorhamnose 3,5-epimerase
MIFRATPLSGAFLIDLSKFEDERGFFAHTWSASEFARHGLESRMVECSVSWNTKRGTLRGMHYQAAPHGQAKLVRCTKGSIFDVIVDLRRASPTFQQWIGVELTAVNRRMLYIPDGFAHGFQTLEDETEVFYQMSSPYVPASGRGVRWNDPAFGIAWPQPDGPIINQRDNNYPDLVADGLET